MFGYCKSDPTIPIEQLDYKFIGSCKDIEKLQKIIKVLRSGDEGIYPDLTKFAEDQLRKQNPKSPLLEKINYEKNLRDLEAEERQSIVENLQGLINDSKVKENGHHKNDEGNGLPPIRSAKTLNVDNENNKNDKNQNTVQNTASNKRITPRSYDEWSKLDKEIDSEGVEIIDNNVKNSKTKINSKGKGSLKAEEMIDAKVKTTLNGVSDEELQLKAENEKKKGNEAFRSGDFAEALLYYNRSLDLKEVPAVYNNRAMTHIKLESFTSAIDDCNSVLKSEPKNIKAFLRRGLAYQALKKLDLALADFTQVVELEPTNKRGKELYETVYKELEKQSESNQQNKGKRLVVEEISSEDTKENINPIIVSSQPCKKGNRLKIEEVESSSETKTDNNTSVTKISVVEQSKPESKLNLNESDQRKVEPAFEAKELPKDSVESKNEGNVLYKKGQYQEAYQKYTFAIQSLMSDPSSFKSALSSLFNNRAICQLKSGNCSECIKDCDRSLKYSTNVKALLRRAMANEQLEKYKDAYVDYQLAFSRQRDPTTSQAMARISKHLKADYGKDWHDKLPKRQDLDWDDQQSTPIMPQHTQSDAQSLDKSSTTIDTPKNSQSKTKSNSLEQLRSIVVEEEKPPKVKTKAKSKQVEFSEIKEKGNGCVKKGNYEEAIEFYTKCINLLPSEVPSYTNRALCYLKLKQPKSTEAIVDCTSALKLQDGNIKALFRRAQSYKLLKRYKEALGDLTTILKEEPKNSAAQKEMDECKELYRVELREIQKSRPKSKGKKMKIEEITSDSINKTQSTKQTTKTDTCPMARGNTNSSQKPASLASKKISGVEFMQMWNGIKSGKSADYAEILRVIDPSKLQELMSNKIDGKILENFIRAVHDHFTSKEHFKYGMLLMKHMYRVQRFSTNLMFLGTAEKTLLKTTIDILDNRVKQECSVDRSLQNEISQLRLQYHCSSA